jgi:CRISPR-associated RAMP protein (TIGR02581 family)
MRETLARRTRLSGELETVTALHIGGGQPQTVVGTDAPVIRDSLGRPFVPGSSFKGVLRSQLEALLRGATESDLVACAAVDDADAACVTRRDRKGVFDQPALSPAEKAAEWEKLLEESCTICSLFGSPWLASRVRVADMAVVGDWRESSFRVRDGVGIDRETLTAVGRLKYDFETVPPGTRFTFALAAENADDWELGLIVTGIDLLNQGFASLGGKGSRGLGRVRVIVIGVEEKTAADFLGLAKEAPAPRSVDEVLDSYREALSRKLRQGGEPRVQDAV